MMEVDAIIVGLGPTGATLAGLLGQRGVRVAVFDRLPDLFPLPRAAGMDHEAMRILQELRIADRVAPFVAPYRPSEYRGMDGGLIKRLDAAPPPHRLGWAPNYVFNQPALERTLRARLAELPGVHVECSAEVVATGSDERCAWAEVRRAGHSERLRVVGRYLVACDGGTSPIRKRLGIEFEDLLFDEPWLVVDALLNEEALARLPQTQVQYCEAQRPCTYVVGVGNHRRWELMLNPGDSLAAEDYPEEQLWPLLARWITPADGRIWRAAAYCFHGLVARQWRRGRVLLAGDAAHMTPPFMAQGMMQGLRDAQNLAWKLERILRHGAPDALLDTYAAERHPHVTATTRAAMALGRVICERDPEQARARDARMRAEQGGAVGTTIRQNLIPGLTAGLIATDSPGAGAILPQPLVASASFAGRLDDLSGPVVRVVAAGPVTPDEARALQAALAPLAGVLVRLGAEAAGDVPGIAAVETERVLSDWLDGLGQRLAVVRADHYVYGTAANAAEALALAEELRMRIDPPGTQPAAAERAASMPG